jgi:sterol desaturase/sphingolipid hydroxylase (fatty acid hydroxylase superfamily)
VLHLILSQWQPAIFVSALVIFSSWETFAPFFIRQKRAKHYLRNLIIAALNALLIVFVFANTIVYLAKYCEENQIGLLYLLNVSGTLHLIAGFLLTDVWTYWWHRLNHIVPFFWRFHRMHHSDPEMDVTTGSRFHFGEITLSSCIRMTLIPILGLSIDSLILFDVVQLPIIHFHHANLFLPNKLDKILRYFIVTPYMHKVHHSRVKSETDSNYTSVLSIWDRIFGSYVEKEDYHEIRFGLDNYDDEASQSLQGLLFTPLRQS